MAVDTLDFRFRMRAGEREIRPLMIKGFVVQLHYFRLASLVLGMAIATRVISYASVITGLVLYVLGNLFVIMTTQTQLVLSATLESLVTGLALVFKLGMTLNQVTRGNHCIKRIHVRFKRCRSKQQYQSHP